MICWPVAQSAVQKAVNFEVDGSSPSWPVGFKMRICKKCGGYLPNNINIDGKIRNMQNRKYCLSCSPFGQHNTKRIHIPGIMDKPIRFCRTCEKEYLGGHGKHKDICPSCRVNENRKNKKRILVEYKGGKCIICNYDKTITALEFHHIDPHIKAFTIAQKMDKNSFAQK